MKEKEFKKLKVGDKVWVYQSDKVESRIVKEKGFELIFTKDCWFVEPNQTFLTKAEAYKYAIKCKKSEIELREILMAEAKKELLKLQKELAKAEKSK